MENINFGPGFGIMVLVLLFFQIAIRTIVILFLILYLTRKIMPLIALQFGCDEKLTGHSRYDVFSYLITWLFIAPFITGLFEIISQMFFGFMAKQRYFGTFSYLSFYLIGLTMWRYDNNFEKFEFNSIRTTLLRTLLFLLLNIILNVISSVFLRSASYTAILPHILNDIFNPIVLVLLTIYYIRKNKRVAY